MQASDTLLDRYAPFEKAMNDIKNYVVAHNLHGAQVFTLNYKYRSLPLEKIKKETIYLNDYLEYIKESVDKSVEAAVWRMMNTMGITPHSSFFNVQPKQYIQFYDKAGVLVFQTFDFFKYHSYTYEDLITADWASLYSRDEAIGKHIYECCDMLVKTKKPVCVNTPEHIVEEKASPEKMAIVMKIKDFYPYYLRGTTDMEGFILTSDVRPYRMAAAGAEVHQLHSESSVDLSL